MKTNPQIDNNQQSTTITIDLPLGAAKIDNDGKVKITMPLRLIDISSSIIDIHKELEENGLSPFERGAITGAMYDALDREMQVIALRKFIV